MRSTCWANGPGQRIGTCRASDVKTSIEPTRRLAPGRGWLGLMALVPGLLAGARVAEVTTLEDPETGLRSWSWIYEGISIELVQRLPDQTRAFFLGRGFGVEDADHIARSCVFQTIFRNDGDQRVDYNLARWSVLHRGETLALLVREAWDRHWEARKVDGAARIAFRWSLLPSVQRFEPGDYNWGMTSFGLAPGEAFGLTLDIERAGERVVGHIPGLRCAVDR